MHSTHSMPAVASMDSMARMHTRMVQQDRGHAGPQSPQQMAALTFVQVQHIKCCVLMSMATFVQFAADNDGAQVNFGQKAACFALI